MSELIVHETSVNVDDSDLGAIVNIKTKDAKVIVNGMVVWEKYEDPRYSLVPVVMRSWIYDHNPEFVYSNDELAIDINYLKENITFYFPKNKNKSTTARFDLVNSVEEVISVIKDADLTDAKKNSLSLELKTKWENISYKCKKFGYKFVFSHSMDESYYGWWDVVFPNDKWDSKKFEEIIKTINEFNTYLVSVEKKNHLKY